MLVRSGWFAHCWCWGASQWHFLPTCSPTDKRTISSRSLDVPPHCLPLSPGQQGKSHPHVILTTVWSTRAALSLDVLKERLIQNAWVCLPGQVRGRPWSQDRVNSAWITLPFLICTKQRLYTLLQVKCSGSSLSSLLKILSLVGSKSLSDLNLLVILTERDNFLYLAATFHVITKKYQVSPQPFPSLPASPPVSPTFPLRPYISGHWWHLLVSWVSLLKHMSKATFRFPVEILELLIPGWYVPPAVPGVAGCLFVLHGVDAHSACRALLACLYRWLSYPFLWSCCFTIFLSSCIFPLSFWIASYFFSAWCFFLVLLSSHL